MLMLFILLIGVARYSSPGRDRHPSLQPALYQILWAELNFVTLNSNISNYFLYDLTVSAFLWLKNEITFNILEQFSSVAVQEAVP